MKKFVIFIFCIFFVFISFAQDDDFGFDKEDAKSEASDEKASSNFSVTVGGDLHAGFNFFFKEFKTAKKFTDVSPNLPVWGRLSVEAKAPLTEAFFGVKLSDKTLPISLGEKAETFPKPIVPSWIDEAYMQVIAGPVVLGGGVKKLTWGRADSMSVLDVINPMDYSDLSILDPEELKIASPAFYMDSYLPFEMKLSAVYLPVFEPHKLAMTGKWKAFDFGSQRDFIEKGILDKYGVFLPNFKLSLTSQDFEKGMKKAMLAKKTNTLAYGQGGLRYTAIIGGFHDIGVQYFTGLLKQPAFQFNYLPTQKSIQTTAAKMTGKLNPSIMEIMVKIPAAINQELGKAFNSAELTYNRFHQIGFDYGAALGPVNLRAELAANITSDLKGDDPFVYNPNIAWNVGLDYTLPYNIMLNLQVVETIRLQQNSIKSGLFSFDIEKDLKQTDTRLVFVLSQRLVRGSLECRIVSTVGIEDKDFLIAPGVHWQFGTLLVDCDLGFFGGDKKGKLGKYRDNHFIKLSVGYKF